MQVNTSLVVVGVLLLVAVATVPGAAAPSNTTTTENSTTDHGQRVMTQVGDHVTVVRFWYDGSKMHVVLDTDLPTMVSVTDSMAGIADSGATEVPFRQVMVTGRTEIVMDVTEYRGGAAVSVGTNDGLVRLSTGVQPANPFAGSSPTMGWLGGAGMAILTFVGAGAWVIRKESGEPEAV